MNTSLNKSLAQFARWANKEQIAKRKEHPSVHGTAEIKKLILRRVIPAKAGIHCVADIFMQSLRGNRYPPARV